MPRQAPRPRLDLIAEALTYVKHVRSLGMESMAYDKALREPNL